MDLHQWMLTDLAGVRAKLFDSVAALIPSDRWHEQVDGGGSTVTHLLLHVARHQDLAVNGVIGHREALFLRHRSDLGLADAPFGAALAEKEDPAISARVAAEPLLAYVRDAFDTTEVWLRSLDPAALDSTPDAAHGLTTHGRLTGDEFPWLYGMWGGKPLWWFVQWPVIGHANAHVGEGISVRNRMGLSPF
jgi:hypothetical protein